MATISSDVLGSYAADAAREVLASLEADAVHVAADEIA